MTTLPYQPLCHIGDCASLARYKSRLEWTNQPEVLLCVAHAADERKWGSVIKIESIESISDVGGDA